MKNPISIFLALFGLASCTTSSDMEFKASQCWSYSTRPSESSSFLVIRKIETLAKVGEVAHISVFELKIKNTEAPNGFSDQVGHLPISITALKSSIKKRVEREIPVEDWMGGYSLWQKDYDSGNGGVFSKPVSECIGFIEEALNRK